jgi:hypothetical protein
MDSGYFNKPVTILNPASSDPNNEDFVEKAQRKGTIFIYQQDGYDTLDGQMLV